MVEQQRYGDVAVLFHSDGRDVANFGEIGNCADWALVGLESFDPDPCLMRQ